MSTAGSAWTSTRVLLTLGALAAGAAALWGARTGVRGTAGGDAPGAAADERTTITALGRLEPEAGVIRVAGPSRPSVVIAKLLVREGEVVDAGRPIAVL